MYSAIGIGALFLFIGFFKSFLKICPPNKVFIFSGRTHTNAMGKTVGYRVIFGGRAIKWPLIETQDELDMSVSSVLVKVTNAYSKGGIPLDVQAIANVKISSDERFVGNAIERFLGRQKAEIVKVAKETLEGNLRGVISTLTPEQINEDRMEFADRIFNDVKKEMDKLGLQLDVFKVQSVSDRQEYLKSLGRKRISDILKDAEIAESSFQAEAKQVEANMSEQSQIAQTKAKDEIKQKENEFRQIQATLEATVQTEEETTIAAAKEAEATAAKELQELRAQLEEIRLQVQEVLPAVAKQQAAQFIAEGESAIVAEKGRAVAYSIDVMSKVWTYAGKDALPISLMQRIEKILFTAASTVDQLHMKNIHVIDSGKGETINGLVKAYTDVIGTVFASVQELVGIDLSDSLKREA
ncbi:flotillin family protein [bacterium]|nr:flotillin family protein [bacterium]